jgi:hypothetical protein
MIAINVSKIITAVFHARTIREPVWGSHGFDNMNVKAAARTDVKSR